MVFYGVDRPCPRDKHSNETETMQKNRRQDAREEQQALRDAEFYSPNQVGAKARHHHEIRKKGKGSHR